MVNKIEKVVMRVKIYRNFIKIVLLCLLVFYFGYGCVSAHKGRTDSRGGHKDKYNASGLGPYHYHCGGHPAHLHENGVCPYSSNASDTKKTTTNSTSSSTSSSSSNISSKSTNNTVNNNTANQKNEEKEDHSSAYIIAGLLGGGGLLASTKKKKKK